MMKSLGFRSASTITLALTCAVVLSACPKGGGIDPKASRGQFGASACEDSARVPVDAAAVIAVYFDADGKPVGAAGIGEDMTGTEHNRMCKTPSPDDNACKAGYCMRNIGGVNYCLKC